MAILIMSAKLATTDLLKITEFWKKGSKVIVAIVIVEVVVKILSRDSNCDLDVIMLPKFCNYSISIREVIITSIYKYLTGKTDFFEGCSWFNTNSLGLN